MNIIEKDTLSELWYEAFKYVLNNGEEVESRIGKTKHVTNFTLCLNSPLDCILYNTKRKTSAKYIMGETTWYFSGHNDVRTISKYASMWSNLTDDGITVNSAYGYRIFKKYGFNQLEYVINKLKNNPYDRQAVIHIKEPSDKPTKDTPCTCLLQFNVYKGKLNCHTFMRSNDLWFGTPYDFVFFCMLQQIVSLETGIPLGKYYHTVGDLHIYENNWIDIDESSIVKGSPLIVDKELKVIDSFNNYLNNNIKDEYFPSCIKELWRIARENK